MMPHCLDAVATVVGYIVLVATAITVLVMIGVTGLETLTSED